MPQDPSTIAPNGQTDSSQALRYNEGKPEMHQLPGALLRGTAEVLTYGARKYASYNWRKGGDWSIPFDCLMRHMFAFWEGEDNDPESGLSHLKHAAANIAFLLTYLDEGVGRDNRPRTALSEDWDATEEVAPTLIEKIAEEVTVANTSDDPGRVPWVPDAPAETLELLRDLMRDRGIDIPRFDDAEIEDFEQSEIARVPTTSPDVKKRVTITESEKQQAELLADVIAEETQKKSDQIDDLQSEIDELRKIKAQEIAYNTLEGQRETALTQLAQGCREALGTEPRSGTPTVELPESDIMRTLPRSLWTPYAEAIGLTKDDSGASKALGDG